MGQSSQLHLIGVLGLIEGKPLMPQKVKTGDLIVLVGITKDELGGSEYYEYIHDIIGGRCPAVDMKSSKDNQGAVLETISQGSGKGSTRLLQGGNWSSEYLRLVSQMKLVAMFF